VIRWRSPVRHSSLLTHVRALLAYASVAILFNWPLPIHLGSHLTGGITGDTGVYVWNIWLFRHEIVQHKAFPLFTQDILALTPPIDLSLHNYTLFANLLGFPLIPLVGVTATFNIVYLLLVTLSAWAMFVLARQVVGRTGEAWLAGLMFGFSPFLVARSEGHFSLVAAAPLPIFVLVLRRLAQRLDLRDAALAGAVVAWACMCDVYYGIYCVLIALCYSAVRYVRVERQPRLAPDAHMRRVIDGVILCLAAIVAIVVTTGGGELRWRGVTLAIKSLYTPVLLLTVAVVARVIMARRPRFTLNRFPSAGVIGRLAGIAALAFGVLLSPVLFALRYRLSDGGELHGPIFWRSSPRGIDLLSLFAPNPNHALYGAPWRAWLTTGPGGYIENVASLTIVGLLVVAVAVWRYRFRPPRVWTALSVGFALLALGPFVHVAGANTYIPTPWTFLRYVPIVSATRTPARFAVVAMLGFSMVFALALARIGRSHPRARRLLLAGIGVALAFELSPFPRHLYAANVPEFYATIAADSRDIRVLELPVGIRDGESSEGDFNASSQFYQTVHGKPLIGGYLSRISQAEKRRQHESQTLSGLIRLSDGADLPPARIEALKRRGAGFVQRARLGYVVIHKRRTPEALRQFAIGAFRLVKVAEENGHELYVPTASAQARQTDAAPR
jgi:hypothetical protein